MDIDASVVLEHMLPAEPAPRVQSGSYASLRNGQVLARSRSEEGVRYGDLDEARGVVERARVLVRGDLKPYVVM